MSKTFEVKGFMRIVCYDAVWFNVEADSMEEALALAKEEPNEYLVDTRNIDVISSDFVDEDLWKVVS